MVIPNVHVGPRVRSWSAVRIMLAAYRLPLLIFMLASALTGGYNIFFLRLLRAASEVDAAGSLSSEALRDLQTSRYILRCITTGAFAVCALSAGNTLCALMYWSLVRVIFTCAGYVPAEPWRCTPHFDAERRHHLQVTWLAQQQWIRKQGVAARQRAAQVLREQHEWWAYQMHMMQQQPPYAYLPPAPGLETPFGPPLASAVTQGQLPASGGASSTGSFLGNEPALPQPVSPKLAAVGSHEASPTPALAAAASLSAGAAFVAASPSYAEVLRPGPAAAQETCLTASRAIHSSSYPSAAATAAAIQTAASSFCSSSSCSSAASETSAARAPDRGPGGANDVQSSAGASLATASLYPRPCTPAVSTESAANPHLVLEYEADGSLRFCGVCQQYKPDGSHHCRACQRCVFDMDHHCHFLNNCIGRDNFKYFFLSAFYSTMSAAVNLALFMIAYLCSAVCQDWGLGWWWLPAGTCAVGACVAYLWVQHIFLLIRGLSTLDRMAEVSAERFLASVSGSQHRRVATAGGCRDDCRMAVDEFVRAVEALVKRLADSVGRHGNFRRNRKATTSSLTTGGWGDGNAGVPPALSSRADRRAQRIALLFGRPRLCLYHLLPLAPPRERMPPLLSSVEGAV
ncbi:hypothetical protein JIQ42_06328 [Leishmania sp. Namibia]|uniref:hypothetical protein n=1 Tax=Leishmania sp. Namibia TaxID=2802991 RepID=UPI001B3CCE08|nr:hypothetical protein JIQ42_06328 [Leishmania sp. Namibia]